MSKFVGFVVYLLIVIAGMFLGYRFLEIEHPAYLMLYGHWVFGFGSYINELIGEKS